MYCFNLSYRLFSKHFQLKYQNYYITSFLSQFQIVFIFRIWSYSLCLSIKLNKVKTIVNFLILEKRTEFNYSILIPFSFIHFDI